MTEESLAFGRRVRQSRMALDPPVSQEELAKALGWSQAKFSKVELGRVERVTPAEVRQLAAQLRVDDYWLFTGRHPQRVSDLAAQIDRLDLDEWGQRAVLEVARREAARASDQQARYDLIQRQMLDAGIPLDATQRAVEQARAIDRGGASAGSPEESRQADRT